MPASQAKTIERMGLVSTAVPPAPLARVAEAIDFLPFIASMSAVARLRSPSSSDLSVFRMNVATKKVAAAPRIHESVTPIRLAAGVCA